MKKRLGRSTAILQINAPRFAELPKGAKDRRLSIAECQKLLGEDCELGVAEIGTIRNQMYALADISISDFVKGNGSRELRQLDESKEAKAA